MSLSDILALCGVRKSSLADKWEFYCSPPNNNISQDDALTATSSIESSPVSNPKESFPTDAFSKSEEADFPEAAATIKKKKPNKHRKKSKSLDQTKTSARHIAWGSVTEHYFRRGVSCCSVPHNGGYPFGLDEYDSSCSFSVDDAFSKQQLELLSRSKIIGISVLPVNSDYGSFSGHPPTLFESRQYDYKKSSNLLFKSISEDERIRNLTGGQWGAAVLINGCDNVSEINKDIKVIRSSRDSCGGCTCKPVKVDKLSVGKLKQEIVSKGHLIHFQGSAADVDNLNKNELMAKVKDILVQCDLCIENQCECVQAGISCSANLCQCMRSGFKPGVSQSCNNPAGREIFDESRVAAYRKTLLGTLQTNDKKN